LFRFSSSRTCFVSLSCVSLHVRRFTSLRFILGARAKRRGGPQLERLQKFGDILTNPRETWRQWATGLGNAARRGARATLFGRSTAMRLLPQLVGTCRNGQNSESLRVSCLARRCEASRKRELFDGSARTARTKALERPKPRHHDEPKSHESGNLRNLEPFYM